MVNSLTEVRARIFCTGISFNQLFVISTPFFSIISKKGILIGSVEKLSGIIVLLCGITASHIINTSLIYFIIIYFYHRYYYIFFS